MQTGQNDTINRIAKQYYKVSLWIIFGLTVIILLVMQYLQSTSLTNALVISALFSLVSSIAYTVMEVCCSARTKDAREILPRCVSLADACSTINSGGGNVHSPWGKECHDRLCGNVRGLLYSNACFRLYLLCPN